jgi:hemoglobin
MNTFIRRACALGLALLWLAGAARAEDAPTLYTRIGGKDATFAITKDLVARVQADERISKKFARSDAGRLETNLRGYLCVILEGECNYNGEQLKTVHKGLGITSGEFDAFMEDFGAALDQQKIVDPDKASVLKAFASSRASVIESPAKTTGTELPAAFKPAPPLK